MVATVLVTGAAGKVGRVVLRELAERGMTPIATDLQRGGVPSEIRFIECDITNRAAVDELVNTVQPEVIVHAAAIVAPISYTQPRLAEAVNVGGTRHLVEAAERLAPEAFFIFTSTYAVFGPTCPSDPYRSSDSPLAPVENYGKHKVICEQVIRSSRLRHCILRLGAVFDSADLIPRHPAYRPMIYLVPFDQPEHGIDVRDVARAIASAAEVQPDGRVLLIAGDESWKTSARRFREEILGALGLSVPSERACRVPPNAEDPAGWFIECWMDTLEAQDVLGFQTVSREQFVGEARRANRWTRWALTLVRPVVHRMVERQSPFVGGGLQPGATLLDDIRRIYGADAS